MSKIQVLVIEDNHNEAQKIKTCLETNNFEVTAIAQTLKEALGIYYSQNIDIVIIDIFLNNVPDGIVFAETIVKNKTTLRPFLFLTSSTSRIIFENAKITNPYSYLLKPYNELELKYALELAIEKFAGEVNTFVKDEYPFIHYNKSFFIKKNNVLVKVEESDIFYITVEGRYCNIHIQNENFTVQLSLKQMMTKISSANFIRVHRNHIVNLKKIQRVFLSDNLILLENNKHVNISKSYKQDLINNYEILI
ncbi:response regulator transcription factor [Aquimarina sp. 2201CG1-2-11]|uniref:LytR/AlgR family response regulator transcription factor n=1 Tax=Aquimarina discodermiae TaxID=3231043 RepID=UPI0034632513